MNSYHTRAKEPAAVEGAKRGEIIDAATRRFGRDGYENTRWADIASDVGVSPTGLYYYFESKQHCLFVILGQAMADIQARFERLAGGDLPPPGPVHSGSSARNAPVAALSLSPGSPAARNARRLT
jgi:TetR/AcrR family transcriptional regulator, cholesterol catabolism regulator